MAKEELVASGREAAGRRCSCCGGAALEDGAVVPCCKNCLPEKVWLQKYLCVRAAEVNPKGPLPELKDQIFILGLRRSKEPRPSWKELVRFWQIEKKAGRATYVIITLE